MNNSVNEFINFLKFSYKYYKKTNTLFYISDKEYFINIIVDEQKKLTILNFDKKHFDEFEKDYNYDLYFDITEILLVKLYQQGVSITELFSHIRNNDIKTNNFGVFKFYAFMKNFDFSANSWNNFFKKN